MNGYKNKTLEELLDMKKELFELWVAQKREYQEKQLKKINYEIEKRKRNEYSRKI